MQPSLNSRIAMVPVLLNPDLPVLPGSASPFRHVAGLSRPLVSILNGIRRAGLLGATDRSSDPASKEGKRLSHEIEQALGINGFVLNLTGSSALATGLPACWDVVRPCLETPELEDATAQICSEASRLAEELGDTRHNSVLRLNHEEAARLQVGLDFYRFLLPKTLVAASALRLACDDELNRRGIVKKCRPAKTAVREDGLHELFQSIRGTFSIAHEPGAVAMPRAWSKYLAMASAQLKPLVQGENFHRASDQLHKVSCRWAPAFQERISAVELDGLEAIAEQVASFESLLPSLIISITLLELYLRPAGCLIPSRPLPSCLPPAASREITPKRHPALLPLMEPPTGMLCPA